MTVVLDASALLAFLYGEPGADVVDAALDAASVSAVNWSETLAKILARGGSADRFGGQLLALGLMVEPFTAEDARAAAGLYPLTSRIGLSLGDRACLALATRLHAPALTANSAWAELDAGVEVRLLRGGSG